MKKYLVLYRSPQTASEMMKSMSAEQAKAGMDAWNTWGARAGSALVDFGSPLGDATTVGPARAKADPAGGFTVLQAESLDHARKLLDGHPHLEMPGATIEVMEYLPLPGM
jgi:hypothetical protein